MVQLERLSEKPEDKDTVVGTAIYPVRIPGSDAVEPARGYTPPACPKLPDSKIRRTRGFPDEHQHGFGGLNASGARMISYAKGSYVRVQHGIDVSVARCDVCARWRRVRANCRCFCMSVYLTLPRSAPHVNVQPRREPKHVYGRPQTFRFRGK